MNLTNEQFNLCLSRYRNKILEISNKYNYPSNLVHSLYVVVPAFIFKYGFKYEDFILKMFEDILIFIKDREDKIYQASFSRILEYDGFNYKSKKCIFLYNYKQADLLQMLDNLIHEFNHALNSLNNEIVFDEEYVYLRTGLTYLKYNRDNLNAFGKQEDVVLEEIINTHQTEDIINIIASFSKYDIEDSEISNIVYTLNRSINGSYRSKSYYLQSSVCLKLLENKTFIHTLETMRFQGVVNDLEKWFDTIVGKNGSFKLINTLLFQMLEMEKELVNVKWFKNRKINKIRALSLEVFKIIEVFNSNCNFK